MPVPRPLVAIERASGTRSARPGTPSDARPRSALALDAGTPSDGGPRDLLADALDPGFGNVIRFLVGPIEGRQVAGDAASTCSIRLPTLTTVKLRSRLLTALNFEPSMAATAPAKSPSWRHSTTNCRHAAWIASPLSRRNRAIRLVVRRQATHKPHEFDVALRLALQSAAGRDAVQIAVEVELQQHRRIVGRTSRRSRLRPGEAQGAQVEFVDESLDDAYRVVLGHVVVQRSGKKPRLTPIFPFDEPTHADLLR